MATVYTGQKCFKLPSNSLPLSINQMLWSNYVISRHVWKCVSRHILKISVNIMILVTQPRKSNTCQELITKLNKANNQSSLLLWDIDSLIVNSRLLLKLYSLFFFSISLDSYETRLGQGAFELRSRCCVCVTIEQSIKLTLLEHHNVNLCQEEVNADYWHCIM